MRYGSILFLLIATLSCTSQPLVAVQEPANLRAEVKDFLDMYNRIDQKLYQVASEAEWKASTDVKEEHTGQRVGANQAKAVFEGSPYIIEKTKNYLKRKDQLDDLTVRQLETVLYDAAENPGTIPDVVTARVAAEARQSAILDGFEFCYDRQGDKCAKVVTPNQLDDILTSSTDLAERKHAWEVSKQTGSALKPGLVELQGLRNQVAREMGFSSFFDLQVSDYGMSVKEMKAAAEEWNAQLKPLYDQLHTWAKHKLAERYKQPVPRLIPAHWLGNRWGQAWPGIVEGVALDELFKGKSPEWIVQQSERFYVSLDMPQLPKSFWEKSDLYELQPNAPRKKNTHASAWHIDLDKDVRSLMSVKANADWFFTSHHELGHVYYYMAYSTADVPVTLRGGANRAFHEAVGDLISIAARQPLYLKEVGVMPKEMNIDQTAYLLNEALDDALVFIPWSAGVMTAWEHDLYEQNLPPDQFNKRWWEYVAKYQGIEPPSARGEEFADAATKTHINDDPAQYYDYAMAYLIKYQLHMHIAKNILKQDPHNCNYYGNKEVGQFLWNILKLGRTKDWRQVIKEATGEEISARAMLEYFAPVMKFLQEENKGRQVGW
jgi:peptidyl-dipeptidase A